MAAAFAKAHAQKAHSGRALRIESRGLTDHYSAWGSPADARAAKVLEAQYGLRSDGHASTLLTRRDVETAHVFYMAQQHVRDVSAVVGKDAVDAAIADGRFRTASLDGHDVPDPYYGDEAYYSQICDLLRSMVAETLDAHLASVDADRRGPPR